MATLAKPQQPQPQQPLAPPSVGDERFVLKSAIVMALIIVAGFSFQLAMGRSTFASPLRVHVHAVLFMGWVAIYLLQNVLVATDRIGLHRRRSHHRCPGWQSGRGWQRARHRNPRLQ